MIMGIFEGNAGGLINNRIAPGIYNLGSFYNYEDGCAIKLGPSNVNTMYNINIRGNSYTDGDNAMPINASFQFYNYADDDTILRCCGVNYGSPIGNMSVFHFDNCIYAYVKQQSDYQTLSFEIITGNSDDSFIMSVDNTGIPDSVTEILEITPINMVLTENELNDIFKEIGI